MRELFQKLNNEETVKNFVAAVKYLETHPKSNGKVGCTGFCWGGGLTNQVAVNSPDLDAAVPYYGTQPSEEEVARIKAPVIKEMTPAMVKPPRAGVLISRINKIKARVRNSKPNQLTGRIPSP